MGKTKSELARVGALIKKPKQTAKNVKPTTPEEPQVVGKRVRILDQEAIDKNPLASQPFTCLCCGKFYKTHQSHAYKSHSVLFKANSMYIPICKDCMVKYYDLCLTFFNGDRAKAVERVCQTFDIYYSQKAFDAAMATYASGRTSVLSAYFSKIQLYSINASATNYLYTLKERQENERRITDVDSLPSASGTEEKQGEAEEKDQLIITKETVRKWGTGMREDEYDYLEEEYNDWCNKVEVKSKSQEELIKNICISQLNIRRAQASNNSKGVQEAQKNFTDLLQNCNLTPRQANEVANSSQAQLSLGSLIKKIENEEPIGEARDEFKDPDGIRNYVSAFFFGHLAKALKIKNDNQKLYDAEIAKYSVKLPEHDNEIEDIEGLLGEHSDG